MELQQLLPYIYSFLGWSSFQSEFVPCNIKIINNIWFNVCELTDQKEIYKLISLLSFEWIVI